MKRILLAAVIALMPLAATAQDFDNVDAASDEDAYALLYVIARGLAALGDASGQHDLGVIYRQGLGVPQDYDEAMRWSRLAAEQGHAGAQSDLGVMYENGWGVPQDDTEAARWYRLSVEQGYARAQTNLGRMYLYGLGVPQDSVEAVRLYKLAAKQGNDLAQDMLHRIEAARKFLASAELGDADTLFTLYKMYAIGDGVPRNFVTAHMWFTIAMANESKKAKLHGTSLWDRITPEQKAEGERRAQVCMESNYKDCH